MNREQKKRETRRRLLDSAKELFAEHGFDATTVEQITERAGVAKGTFFNYFHSKEEVLCDLQIGWAYEEVVRLAGKDGPLIPRLQALLQEIVHRAHFSKPLTRAIFRSALGGGRPMCEFAEQNRHLAAALAEVFAEGQERGEIARGMPAAMMAEVALQTFYGVLLLWSVAEDEDSRLGEQLALAFDIFLQGIAADRHFRMAGGR